MDRVSKVANFYLSKQSMSPKKLQKILYYAYAWTLALLNDDEEHLNNRLFDSKFEAWVHGPVLPEVFATNRDCIDECERAVKLDQKRLQMIMETYVQV